MAVGRVMCSGVWCVVCGVWCVVCGVWCSGVVCGVCCVVCGVCCVIIIMPPCDRTVAHAQHRKKCGVIVLLLSYMLLFHYHALSSYCFIIIEF